MPPLAPSAAKPGWRTGWRALDALGLHRRVILCRCRLPGETREVTPPFRIVGPLGSPDLAKVTRFRRDLSVDILRARLERELLCFGVELDGELVTLVWGSTSATEVPYLHCRLTPPSGWIYVFDAFTDPRHRGRRLAIAATSALHAQSARSGLAWAVAGVVASNRASRRFLTVVGYQSCAIVGFSGIGPLRSYFQA